MTTVDDTGPLTLVDPEPSQPDNSVELSPEQKEILAELDEIYDLHVDRLRNLMKKAFTDRNRAHRAVDDPP